MQANDDDHDDNNNAVCICLQATILFAMIMIKSD